MRSVISTIKRLMMIPECHLSDCVALAGDISAASQTMQTSCVDCLTTHRDVWFASQSVCHSYSCCFIRQSSYWDNRSCM